MIEKFGFSRVFLDHRLNGNLPLREEGAGRLCGSGVISCYTQSNGLASTTSKTCTHSRGFLDGEHTCVMCSQ